MKKLILIACIALSANAFAQKVSGKINYPKGKKLEVVTTTKKEASMDVMGQSIESGVDATLTESFDIEDVNANGATIEYKVKRLVFTANSMGNNQEFDSEKEGDRKGEVGKVLEKGLKNKYTMKVDAHGKVLEVKADDDNPNGKSSEDDAVAAMLSMQLGTNFQLPKAGDATIFAILPAREIAQGDSWTDSTMNNGAKTVTVYKVNSITATDIILDFTQQTTVNTTQTMMGTEATINTEDKGKGQVVLDKSTGLMKQKTETLESSGTIEAQGMSIPISGKTTINVAVK